MTKNDYIVIAKVLNKRLSPYLEPGTNVETYRALRDVSEDFVEELSKLNPKFSRDKFLTACGFTD